jgi:dynein heavy chain
MFQKMLLVKALREEKGSDAVVEFVGANLGAIFVKSPPTTMADLYADLDAKTPCIFVLSTGADPTGILLRFAAELKYTERMHMISLGQGQGPRAEALIDNSLKTGDWVLLQVCEIRIKIAIHLHLT